MTSDSPSRTRRAEFPIVGIGASAGGLEAFLEFFHALRTPSGMAFVLVTHLQPDHESQLAEIVATATTLTVKTAEDNDPVVPDHLYILPPNASITLKDGRLRLSTRVAGQPHYPIDHFLASLAEDHGSNAIGIIFSGGGTDGAQGLQAIRSRYGLTCCQDPQTAQHTGMPHSAIAGGTVDLILSPADLAAALSDFRKRPVLPAAVADREFDTSSQEFKEFARILQLLKASHLVDFTQYKPSTISRRIARRAQFHQCASLNEYLKYLEAHPLELDELYRDILISVTSFFREPGMFDALGELVGPTLAGRKTNDPFRIWISGCATGEEVYSFAIAILEIIEQSGRPIPVQIFGTDISDTAIDRARAGVYPDRISTEVSPERLRRFFTTVDSGYRIAENVRQNCIFAHHDLTADPPFSQMDLISCRNVLIYLGLTSQNRVMGTLHYGLKPGGVLVLGTAETVGTRSDLFVAVNQEHKIYTRKNVPGGRLALNFHTDVPVRPEPEFPLQLSAPPPSFVDIEGRAARLMRDLYAPSGVIISEDLQILHFHGRTGFYLAQSGGEASLNLLRMARGNLLYPLRSLLDRAFQTKAPVHEAGIRVEHDSEAREITLRIVPVTEKVPTYLVLFEETSVNGKSASPMRGESAGPIEPPSSEPRNEVARMRDYLRKLIEEHEAATEELRAANEEARSSNEELQSTNEELRTAKEELQSSNEELTTVNEELKHRNEDFRRVNNDLTNVLSAAAIPILMIDMDLRLRRFTPAAERLLGLAASDLGQSLTTLRHSFSRDGLGTMVSDTLEHLETQNTRVQDRLGRWFEVFVRPYRTTDDRIEGAVVAFIDVHESTRALEEAQAARNFANGIVETVQHPLVVLDQNLRLVRATDAFYRTFDVSASDAAGVLFREVGNGEWNFPELRQLLDLALVRDVPFRDLEIELEFRQLGRRTMRLNARRIAGAAQQERLLLLAIEDVTERKATAEIQYRRLFESARDAIVIVDAQGRVLDVNPYFGELTRYARSNVVGRDLRDLEIFRESQEMRGLVTETRQARSCRYESVPVTARDGAELVLEMIANSYRVRDQECIQLNIRDVTERRRMEDRLRSSNLDLQQFAFAASHDLQEPLRTVTGFSQLLKQALAGKLEPETERYLEFIVGATARMRQMVLDLLGYAQVVRAEVRPSPVPVEAALSSVLLNLQFAVQSSGAHITFDPLPTVLMDQGHLVQLLQNIIGNAIKYRGPDPPEVHLSARSAGREWQISVSDNGIGIDPQYAEHVFTIFKRLHGVEFAGSGIGLAICKRIVERYGGRIWLEPGPSGKGSVFSFTLPKEAP